MQTHARRAIIIGSTRPSCNGKPIAAWVHQLIQQCSTITSAESCSFELVDLSQWHLPIFDEPGIPARHAPVHEHTKAWQAKIASFSGFLFVTPQVPAPNALCASNADIICAELVYLYIAAVQLGLSSSLEKCD